MPPISRVLFIDAYDSFSNNIIALLETELGVNVVKIFIDTPIDDLSTFLKTFDAIVCGPGPGNPNHKNDVGLFTQIWALGEQDILPTLGICLGFQSLALHFGGRIFQLKRPRHGLATSIVSSEESIFRGIPHARAIQYHSLHVSLGHSLTNVITDGLWEPSVQAPNLTPLAWDVPNNQEEFRRENSSAILMSVKHRYKPFYGVQFHPESICSEPTARSIIKNWWLETQAWWEQTRRIQLPLTERVLGNDTKAFKADHSPSRSSTISTASSRDPWTSPTSTAPSILSSTHLPLHYVEQELGNLTVPVVCELLHAVEGEVIIFDSECRPMEGLGESSIIGLIGPETTKISYSVGTSSVTLETGGTKRICDLKPYGGDIFTYLNDFLADRAIAEHPDNVFCGGLMGYVNYEAGLETIAIATSATSGRPDICFAFVERSIVLDHARGKLYVQSLKSEDHLGSDSWVTKTASVLASEKLGASTVITSTTPLDSAQELYQCKIPCEEEYRTKIRACQTQIRAGESYEICLTDQTSINLEKTNADLQLPWHRYCVQRQLNRAPFAAYIRLGPLTLLSSSPERFLRWSRPTTDYRSQVPKRVSTCQFRPIKGTVKKWETVKDGSSRKVTLEEATAILSTPKEQAENLMIVDLIRHDLHGVAGAGNVSVPALMVFEEYETVYQLVSLIEGRLSCPLLPEFPPGAATGISSSHPAHGDLDEESFSTDRRHNTGIHVLAAALPPGSMTGAPKRRACRLLRDIEQHQPRSIYSGVVGYMCVTGKGDFSVVIRTAYRWDDEIVAHGGRSSETWHIGAGGAITDLSTEEGEWEEMLTKLHGTLRSFAPDRKEGV